MEKSNIFFVGIGGIGMSALARYFKHERCNVAGYDRTPSALTRELESEGINIHYTDNSELIPTQFLDPDTTLVIYTPAIPASHSELQLFRKQGFEIVKRSQVLGLLSQGKYLMAVAGTHGKTTTSTMAAHFNTVGAGEGSAILGGIARNFGTNMVLGTGSRLVVEADEFDRSFLQLYPDAAVVTSTDADHLDIYGTHQSLREAFDSFVSQIKPGGTLILRHGLKLNADPERIKIYTYSLDTPNSHYHARNITLLEGGYYRFDIVTPQQTITDCTLGIPGLINVENCIGAVALVDQKGFKADQLRQAIASFRGVARRFDFWINTPQGVYMDDYAHHPEELRAMLTSVRNMFPGRHITLAFQPHLYSRTRDFAPQFAEALSLADHLLMLPIYPAREEPIDGVSSQMIYQNITTTKELIEKEELVERISQIGTDIVLTAGAGDIDRLCSQVAQIVQQKTE